MENMTLPKTIAAVTMKNQSMMRNIAVVTMKNQSMKMSIAAVTMKKVTAVAIMKVTKRRKDSSKRWE